MNPCLYIEDILKDGFEQTTLVLPDDYEGKTVATLVRKQNDLKTNKAVLYVHGFNDYFFQKNIAQEFLKNGYNFYAIDLRKYGRSILPHQKINNVRDLSEYFDEIDLALQIIRFEQNTQVVLAGHSTGGLICSLYAASRQKSEYFKAVFCNSPFYDMNLPNYQKKYLVPFVSRFGKKFPDVKLTGGFSEFYGKSLHKQYHGEWEYDLNWKPNKAYPIHAGWIAAITKGHATIKKGITLDKPILIMHAQKSIFPSEWSEEMFRGDAILNIKDIIANAKKIVAPQKSIVGIEDAIHDLFLSKTASRKMVFKILFDWLQKNAFEV